LERVPDRSVGDPAVNNGHVPPQQIRRTLRLLAFAIAIALIPALMHAPFAALVPVLPPTAIDAGLAVVSFGLALAIVVSGWKPVDVRMGYDTLALIAAFLGAAVAATALMVVGAVPSAHAGQADNLHHVMGLFSAAGVLAAALALAYRVVFHQATIGSNAQARRPAELPTAASASRLESLLELSWDWYWEQDKDLRFTLTTRLGSDHAGISPDQVIGKTRFDLPNEFESEQARRKHQADLDARRPFRDLVLRRRGDEGQIFYASISGEPSFDDQGNFAGYRGLGRDITKLKLAEEALKKSEELFRSLLELTSHWTWEQDANFRYTAVSKLYPGWDINPLGKTRWELPWLEVTPQQRAEHDATLAAHKAFHDFELPAPDGTGGVRWISITGEPVFNADGVFSGYRGITMDVTRRKLAELKLQESEQLARSMLDGLATHVCILDRNGTIVAINSAWEAYCSENDKAPGHVCAGSDYLESVGCDPGPYLEAMSSGLQQVLTGERKQFAFEYPRHSTRSRRWYLAKATRIPGEGALRVVVSHDEITPIKRAEQILSIEKQVLELLAADHPVSEVLEALCKSFEQISWEGRYAIWALDAERKYLRVKAAPSLPPTYLEYADGVAPGEGTGSCAAAVNRREPVFCSDIERDSVWDSWREVAVLHGLRASWSFPVLRGSEVLGAVAVYFGSPREPDENERELLERATHLAGIVFDHAYAEERRRLMAEVFVSSQEGIIISDAQNRIVMVNRAFTEITGYTAAEALGKNPRMLSSGLQDATFYQAMWSNIQKKGYWRGDLWDRHKNGDVYCETLSITTVWNQRGEITHYVAIFADITEKKAAEEKILRMNIELEQRVQERTRRLAAANKELDAFSYSVSHDLRAPLRSIEGFSRVVATRYAESLDETGRDYLDRIDRATRRMNQLIDDMLKLSRISMAEVRKSRVDLSSMAHTILAELSSATKPTRSMELRVDEHLSVEADPGLVRIALENLLANAWKFTSRTAHARIEVCALPAEEGTGFLVRDNGAGFDMKYAEKLFGAFQRLHGPAEFEGTGVGLAIVRRIANLHGWSLRAEGESGKGAVFRVVTSVQ